MYIGWISAEPEDKEALEALGVNVGVYSDWVNAFRGCLATEACVDRLKKVWNKPHKFIRE